jgi:diadenylate cyclase
MEKTLQNILSFVKTFSEAYVLEAFRHIGVIDVIDILLLTVVFYCIYRFVRDRRAGKLAIGLLLIMGIMACSEVFDMRAIQYVFANFYQVGFIAIIIVFQPELRAALEKMGGATPLTGLKSLGSAENRDMVALTHAVDNLCEAVCDLSLDKTGALIVIERSTKLGEYIKPADEINATLSPLLIRNLFFNKAPLHDGAVIIRDMRIQAAGCLLPLSTNEEIDKNLGTRHRAGIGITEVSDAVVIIVSEETGVISLACGGALKRNFNYNSLKKELLSQLSHSTAPFVTKREKETEK